MSEERRYVYMRRTQSGNGVRIRDEEIVYIASIKSLQAFLRGEREFVAFAKFPYRYPLDRTERDCILTYCDKCQKITTHRKVRENIYRCLVCGTEHTENELIYKARTIIQE